MKKKRQIQAAIHYLDVILRGCATEEEVRGALMQQITLEWVLGRNNLFDELLADFEYSQGIRTVIE